MNISIDALKPEKNSFPLIDHLLLSGKLKPKDIIRLGRRSSYLYNAVFRYERFRIDSYYGVKPGEYYGFIPFSFDDEIFITEAIIKRLGRKVFSRPLDVGSGTGNIMFLWKYYFEFEEVWGIEIDNNYIKRYLFILDKLGIERGPYFKGNYSHCTLDGQFIINKDALEFSYSGFSAIRMYHPIEDNETMLRLYERIMSTMDVGAIMWDTYRFYDIRTLESQFNLKNIPDNFFGIVLKKVSQDTFKFI